MAWTGYQIFLAGMLIVTGSINTLATKWADRTMAPGKPGGHTRDGNSTSDPHKFAHPFLQASGMFLGEFTCLIFFKIMWWIYARRSVLPEHLPGLLQGNNDFNPLIFLAPAMCDMVATSVMYIGLNLTFASSFQMFRGAVIVFTGLFSMIFLKRRLFAYKWIGITIVLAGLAIIGCADMFFPDSSKRADDPSSESIITGDLLIVVAQIISATQMVLEEKFVCEKNVAPLRAVGWEGFFGMTTLGLLLIPMYYINYRGVPIEDSLDGLYQIANSWEIAAGLGGTVLSISFFNFAGVSVTKEMSATTRMVLDSVRTLVIWVFSMVVRWHKFNLLTLGGFVVLLSGMMLYNNVLFMPLLRKIGWVSNPQEREEDTRPMVEEES